MKTYLDCIPCFTGQALDSLRMVCDCEETHEKALRRVLSALSGMEMSRTPPEMGRVVHRIIREETGVDDPYAAIKKESTIAALNVMDDVRKTISDSKNPFRTAVRYAIAGNVLDFARACKFDKEKLSDCLADAVSKSLDETELENLETALQYAKSILILGDNAGETVFDRLLIEQMPAGIIKYAVKSAPIINDATLDDARDAGLDKVATLIENGSDAPGTVLELCSDEFIKIYREADIVIAKGQANYETLCGADRQIYFLTQIKCSIIARDLEGEVGDWVVTTNEVSLVKEGGSN